MPEPNASEQQSGGTKPPVTAPAPSAQWRPVPKEKTETGVDLPISDATPAHPLIAASPAPAPSATETAAATPAVVSPAPAKTTPDDPLSCSVDPLTAAVASSSSAVVTQPSFAAAMAREAAHRVMVGLESADDGDAKSGLRTAGGSEDAFWFPWSAMKSGILQEFTTDQRIAITVSFKTLGGPGSSPQKMSVGRDTKLSRLEELDRSGGGAAPSTGAASVSTTPAGAAQNAGSVGEDGGKQQTVQVTQKEYMRHLETMHNEMIQAWETEDRVKTLKVVIQVSKLLNDTSVPVFYPSKFVLITEMLDAFGSLVYDRIRNRLKVPKGATLPQSLIDQAIETCRNWFYKIASIRELIPRIYTEMAIMRCHRFLSATAAKYKEVVDNLCWQLRGIADPLVQAYAVCYLARKAHEVVPSEKLFLLRCLHDTLQLHDALGPERFAKIRAAMGNMSPEEYNKLYSPALEWLLKCIAHRADQGILEAILTEYTKTKAKNALVLNHVISSFPPEYVTATSVRLTQLIRECDTTVFPQHLLYRTLGVNLSLVSPPIGQELVILNDVWKVVTKMESISQYLSVAEVFVEYTLNHCRPREVNILLRDVVAHVKAAPGASDDNCVLGMLLSVMQKIVGKYESSFSTLFGGQLDHFVRILDILSPHPSFMGSVSRSILESLAKTAGTEDLPTPADPVLVTSLFGVATAVHDSVSSVSSQDEVRQASRLISSFVAKVDYGREVERQLNFYVDCRDCFSNLDSVRSQLVLSVASLAMRVLGMTKRRAHTAKTAAFVRACVAYCFTTIPTMEDVMSRLSLYLLVGQIALTNQCVSQADSLFRAAITLLQEVPQPCPNETLLGSFLSDFVSTLVAVPGHPELGPFYLFQGLLTVLDDFKWQRCSAVRGEVYCRVLDALAAMGQQKLPYHLGSSEANDVLYRGDPEYGEQLNKIASSVATKLSKIVEELQKEPDSVSQRAKVGLDIFQSVTVHWAINPVTATLAYTAAAMAKEAVVANPPALALWKSSVALLRPRATRLDQELLKKLLQLP